MDDYISRMVVLNEADHTAMYDERDHKTMVAMLRTCPAADVRPVVYCKDCKNYDTACCGDGFGWCDEFNQGMLDDGFCCFGERREGGTP